MMLPMRGPTIDSNERNPCSTSSVLIVDDDARVRRLLGALLVKAFPEMGFGEASDVPQMLAQLASRPWSALLLDIVMPGRSGLEALPEIRASYPELPVLIVSMHEEEKYAHVALQAGASGYLSKDQAPVRLGAAMRAILPSRKLMSASLPASR